MWLMVVGVWLSGKLCIWLVMKVCNWCVLVMW